VKDPEDGKTADQDDDPKVHEDDTEPPVQVTNPEPPAEPVVENDEPTDADILEAQNVSLLFDAIGNSLGWNMDEIDEKDRPINTDQLA